MKGLTKRQRELLDYIQEFIDNNRYSPSYREIAARFGLQSVGSVHKHVHTLIRKGFINSEEKVSRSLQPNEEKVLPTSPAEISVPLIGNISAGMPIQTFSQTQEIQVPACYVRSPQKTYALRVKGDSLNEEMIADGDLLLVEVRQQTQPGETVVALINGTDIIVKKMFKEGAYIRLQGALTTHTPILLREEDISVQAVVTCVVRVYA